jgi:virginiamycin A acetyltransferase
MRESLKTIARVLATAAITPALLSYAIRRRVIGNDRALEGSTQALAWLPGLAGAYLRGAFLARVLAAFHHTAAVHFGTILSQAGARIDEHVYVGPGCHLGLVHLERDVLVASGVQIPSGPETHGTTRLDIPIREQPGRLVMVRVGEGSWIGSGAVVMADVGRYCVVAAGSVVTKPIPDYSVAAGVPAKVLRDRRIMTSD